MLHLKWKIFPLKQKQMKNKDISGPDFNDQSSKMIYLTVDFLAGVVLS